MAIPWDLAVANRTGVAVQQGGSVLNYTEQLIGVEVNGERLRWTPVMLYLSTYNFGQIQQQRPRWRVKQISTFSQRSVDRVFRSGTVLHSKDLQLENVTDLLQFKVSIEGKSSRRAGVSYYDTVAKFTLLKNVASRDQ